MRVENKGLVTLLVVAAVWLFRVARAGGDARGGHGGKTDRRCCGAAVRLRLDETQIAVASVD